MMARLGIFALSIPLSLGSCDRREVTWSPEGKPIGEVSIEFVGRKTVDEDRLRNVIRSAAGSHYTTEIADADIRALYESGLVEDVRVLAELANGNVRLVFEVTTRLPFGPPLFIGNTAFSDVRLAHELDFDRDTSPVALTPERFDANATKIEDFYRSRGYPKASVRVRAFDGGPATQDDFRFIIEEDDQQPSE